MCALSSPAVRPIVGGGVPRRAATAASDARERAPGKKRPRVDVAPARLDSSSACLTKMTRNRNSSVVIVTAAADEMSSQELLKKRLASELHALRGLLKKAELVSQRGAGKGGAPAAGNKKRSFLASNQRPKPTQEDFNVPSVKRRKMPMRLDKFAEEIKHEKLAVAEEESKVAEESKGQVVREQKEEEYADISGGLPRIIEKETCSKPSGDSDDKKVQVQQSSEAKEAQQRAAPKAVDMRRLLYRANLRRQLLEMERAAPPDQSIDPRDLRRLGIAEYGHPSLMRQLGLVLKVDA